MDGSISAVRADAKVNIPVAMTREKVAAVISLLNGTPQLVAKLLYGSGLRIMEAIRLTIQDLDFGMKQIIVRSGKGDKDRITTFPLSLTPLLQNHLAKVKTLHEQRLTKGHGDVYLESGKTNAGILLTWKDSTSSWSEAKSTTPDPHLPGFVRQDQLATSVRKNTHWS